MRNRKQSRAGVRSRFVKEALRRAAGLAVEPLEGRVMLTTTVFLDFGTAFPAGGLNMTVQQFRDIAGADTGPDLSADNNNDSNADYADGDNLNFAPMSFDYDGDGDQDGDDVTALANDVLPIVQRAYAPFNVNVVLAAAASIADVQMSLAANGGGNDSGNNDAYNFISTVTSAASTPNSVGSWTNLFGLAAGDLDLNGSGQNDNDEVTITFFDTIQALGGPSLQHRVAYTAAHEAAHTFGLAHSDGNPNADLRLLTRGDQIRVGSDTRDSFNIFTRYDLARQNPPGGSYNNYDRLTSDPNIGAKPGFAYVTGTGGHDRITLTRLNATEATVLVEAFRASGRAAGDFISSMTYTIDVTQAVIIESSINDDQIIYDAAIGRPALIRGGDDNDELVINSTDASLAFNDVTYLATGAGEGAIIFDGGAFQLVFEELEPLTLDVAMTNLTVNIVNNAANTVTVGDDGTAGDDFSLIDLDGDLEDLTFRSPDNLVLDTFSEDDVVTVSNFDSLFGGSVTIQGGMGNDTINAAALTSLGIEIQGEAGDDTLRGGGGDDTIDGSADDDSIFGNGGGDSILAGGGADYVEGNAGADGIDGSGGADDIFGGTENDTIDGGLGEDEIHGGAGDDEVHGDGDDDDIFGDAGVDYLEGGQGDDSILGGADADSIVGDGSVAGVAGKDTIDGDGGGDVILGDAGTIVGGVATLIDGGDDDSIHGGDGDDLIYAQGGNDTACGDAGNDTIHGGPGNDSLCGNDGDDSLFGEDGDDILDGGAGSDHLEGGAGNDSSLGGEGNDTMVGDAGDDYMEGNEDADSLVGGAGEDDLIGGSSTAGRLDGGDFIDGGDGHDAIVGDNGSIARTVLSGGVLDRYGPGEGLENGAVQRTIVLLDLNTIGGGDVMLGDTGDDTMLSGLGDDALSGGDGHDDMVAGLGADTADGGAGDDGIIGDNGWITPDLLDGSTAATISTQDSLAVANIDAAGTRKRWVELIDAVLGGADVLLGGDGDDSLHAGAADDLLDGQGGSDALFGNSGGDGLLGGGGTDYLFGGSGMDAMDGQAGGDIAYGGTDGDTLTADSAEDRLVDSAGNFNDFYVPTAGYGAQIIIRSNAPQITAFMLALATGYGAVDALLEISPVVPAPTDSGPGGRAG